MPLYVEEVIGPTKSLLWPFKYLPTANSVVALPLVIVNLSTIVVEDGVACETVVDQFAPGAVIVPGSVNIVGEA